MLGVWLRLFGNSFGAAFAAVAAQLGVAQAVGIISWDDVGTAEAWRTTLTWVAFIHLVAVLSGAAIGRTLSRRRGRGGPGQTTGDRSGAAFAAALGASVAALLAWLPAHAARPPVSVHPELVVVLTAGAGVAAGLVLAVAAVFIAPVAGALRAAIIYAWALAIVCVVIAVVGHVAYPVPRLGVPDAPSVLPEAWWSGPYVLVGAAVLLSGGVALVARWGGAPRGGVAVSGLAGPAAIAIAYLIPGQGFAGDELAPLVAMGAGLAISAIVALPPQRRSADRAADNAAVSAAGPADATATGSAPSIAERDQSKTAPAGRPATATGPAARLDPAARHETEPAGRHERAGRSEPTGWGETPLRSGTPVPSEPTAWNGPTGARPATVSAPAANPLPSRQPVPTQRTGRGQTYGSGAVYGTPPAQQVSSPPVSPAPAPAHAAAPVVAKASVTAAAPVMGRPPRTADEEYSEWLRDLGPTPPNQ